MNLLKLLLALAVLAPFSSQAACTPSTPDDCKDYNLKLIRSFDSQSVTRYQNGESAVTDIFDEAHDILRQFDIPTYKTHLELVKFPQAKLREVIVTEYLRARSDGLPWHPFSFTVVQQHIEQTYEDIISEFENRVLQASTDINQEQVMIGWMFSNLVPHVYNSNLIQEIRVQADELGRDHKAFWDIRVEIHQAPGLRTIERVKKYMKENPSYRSEAKEILDNLNLLFGQGSLQAFFSNYNVDSKTKGILEGASTFIGRFQKGNTAKFPKLATAHLLNLGTLAREIGRKIRISAKNQGVTCRFGREIECRYELIDLLKQIQSFSYTIGNLFYDHMTTNSLTLSIRDQLNIIGSFLDVSWALGITPESVINKLEKIQNNYSTASFSQIDYGNFLRDVETSILTAQQNIAASFGREFSKMKPFVPTVERFIDDTLRATPLLPMSNLIKSLILSNQGATGLTIKIGGNDIQTIFRVLNPGIAKGKLYLADPTDIMSHDMTYDPDGIYYLPKTPAELHKVAGVITADSGSIISHVQLLAANHGLPNVYLSKTMEKEIAKMDGQEILVIALPNGEAKIKLFANATQEELDAYKAYHKIKDDQKVKIKTPPNLDKYTYPIPLEKLRLKHSGVLAGGKACGLGELASTFPLTVPRGFVLPFGVYNDHVLKTPAIKVLIDKAFKDPTVSNDLNLRKQALKEVRDAIAALTLKDPIKDWIRKALAKPAFTDEKSGNLRGVFVRSDTNAEDLPGFVGAGLNQTVANVTSVEEVFEAIKTVWASPFKEKAISWRKDLIENPWEVYPSVIIQLGINSDKAGVMIVGSTDSKEDMEDTVIIASNEGVGISVVSGSYGPEEVSYSRKSDDITRLRKAFAPKKLVLNRKGGVIEVNSSGMNEIMSDEEIKTLADMGNTIQKVLEQKQGKLGKWDLEWGYYKGKPILFQVRPFIGNKIVKNLAALDALKSKKQVKTISYTMNSELVILSGDDL